VDRVEVLGHALALVEQQRLGEAKRTLEALVRTPDGVGEDMMGFTALRTLARCHRVDREFDAARTRGSQALDLATRLQNPAAQAAMLEGLALIESADGRLASAAAYFYRSAEVERARGDFAGEGAALSNYANMLIGNDIEGAEPLLRRALDHTEPDTPYYGSAADNLGMELERQGRHDEAADWAQRSVDAFRARDQPYDVFTALRNLARHLRYAERPAEAAEAFEAAHDLIHELRRAHIDEAHYEAYPQRVEMIEERTREIVKDDGDASWLTIGANAYLGEEAMKEGERALEEGRFRDAIEALTRAREHWMKLDALHVLVRVEHHLAYAMIEIGEDRAALEIVMRVRALAQSLGDAFRESMALSLLVRLRYLMVIDALDLLAQMRVLDALAARQLGVEPDEARRVDGGVSAALAAGICMEAQAYTLAERYMDEALSEGRRMPELLRYRLGYRLHNAYNLYGRAGKPERGAEVLAEFREIVADLDDARLDIALARTVAFEAFRSGDRSEQTLAGLLDACRAYERLRGQAIGGGSLEGFSDAVDPPFEEAAELALSLGRSRLALSLLELGKARTLLEALGVPTPALPPLEADAPTPPAIGDAVGIELLVSSDKITIVTLDGSTGAVASSEIAEEHDGVGSLAKALRRLLDAADSERALVPGGGALESVLGHPTFERLCSELIAAAPPGRAAWLAPHRFLHQAPLQLANLARGETEQIAWSIVPALSVVGSLPKPSRGRAGAVLAVCGDPLSNLPFARVEARLIAKAGPALLALGQECDADWLRDCCASHDVGVLHLACHGRFDRGHPERSGLLLADTNVATLPGTTPAHLMTVGELAALRLDGAIVVLSACSSGLTAIREGDEASGLVSALLQAGAAAIVASQWPVGDLSAMLMMVDFHRRLRAASGDADLGALLADAAAGLRSLSAVGLCDRGFAIAEELGASDPDAISVAAGCVGAALTAMGDKASLDVLAHVLEHPPGDPLGALQALRPVVGEKGAVLPFADPTNWGAFAVVGRRAV
jgi:CHAT domain-containing protein/tetratricopeptide (TPR) repeat protein